MITTSSTHTPDLSRYHMPYTAAVSLCSQGRKGSRFWTTTHGCHVTAPPPRTTSPTHTPRPLSVPHALCGCCEPLLTGLQGVPLLDNDTWLPHHSATTPPASRTNSGVANTNAKASQRQRQLQRTPTPTPTPMSTTTPTLARNARRWGRFFYFLLFFIFIPLTTCHCCEHLLAGCLLISFI